MNDDELRSELGKLVRQLAREGERDHELTTMLREHLGDDARELPVLIEELHAWDLPNLQLALDAAVAGDAWSSRGIGLAGHPTPYHGLGLGDLRAGGRHLSRGVLLWGPPGTGKTHTVRYLTSVATDATVVLLSGGMLGMVGAFAELARRLAPALLVLEDVDLVAQ